MHPLRKRLKDFGEFNLKFIKKSTGEERVGNFKYAEDQKFEDDHDVVTLNDLDNDGSYRSVDIHTIIEIKKI